jgi:hypothetical protein
MKKLTTFILGIVVGAVAVFEGVIYFQSQPEKDNDILFPIRLLVRTIRKVIWPK